MDFGRYGQHGIKLSGAPESVAQVIAWYNTAIKKGTDLQGIWQTTYVEGSLKAGGRVDANREIVADAWRCRTAIRVGEVQADFSGLSVALEIFESVYDMDIVFPAI